MIIVKILCFVMLSNCFLAAPIDDTITTLTTTTAEDISAETTTMSDVLQSQSTSNPTSISQVAAQAALEGSQDCITPMVTAFKARHQYVVDRFNTMPGLSCLMAGGAFYAFPDARKAIANLHKVGKIKAATDMAFAENLLEEFDVAVVPGSAFGAEGYFRISFATSMDNLRNALDRIDNALK